MQTNECTGQILRLFSQRMVHLQVCFSYKYLTKRHQSLYQF